MTLINEHVNRKTLFLNVLLIRSYMLLILNMKVIFKWDGKRTLEVGLAEVQKCVGSLTDNKCA